MLFLSIDIVGVAARTRNNSRQLHGTESFAATEVRGRAKGACQRFPWWLFSGPSLPIIHRRTRPRWSCFVYNRSRKHRPFATKKRGSRQEVEKGAAPAPASKYKTQNHEHYCPCTYKSVENWVEHQTLYSVLTNGSACSPTRHKTVVRQRNTTRQLDVCVVSRPQAWKKQYTSKLPFSPAMSYA